MRYTKPIAFLVIWALLALVVVALIPEFRRAFEPRTGVFVLALPWLLCFAGTGPTAAFRALRDGLSLDAADLPADRRRRSVGILRRLGGLSLSTGVLAFFVTTLATFNAIATGGRVNPMEFLVSAPTAFLAPLYGYLLRVFFYGPLAAALEGVDSGLGLDLEEADGDAAADRR